MAKTVIITAPVGKAKSVVLAEEGMDESNRLLAKLFSVENDQGTST